MLQSINASFKDYPQTTIITLEMADQGAGEKAAPGFDKSIEELFESAFPLATVEIRERLGEIEVTLPLDSLFSPGGSEIQGRNEAVLDRLSVLLGIETPGKRREVEALLPWLSSMRGHEPIPGGPLVVNRAGALARELTARGVPAAAIAIGIERRNADSMRFLFMTRTINTPDGAAKDTP